MSGGAGAPVSGDATREGRGAPMRGFSHTNIVTEVPA